MRPCASTRGLGGASPSGASSSDLGAFNDGVCVDGGSPGRKSDGAKRSAGFLDGIALATLLAGDAARVSSATPSGLVGDMGDCFTFTLEKHRKVWRGGDRGEQESGK